MQINLLLYQDGFLFSTRKFPAIVSAVGTGKTMMLLLKAWNHAEQFPGSVALIVRREFSDLRDSTIKDFKRYFGKNIDSNKEYKFPNGSVIMFRHGAELDVLKNMTLSFVGIEQAEEFETDEQFIFLRDRLRNPIGTRQLAIIANANGHNWVWKLWINGAEEITTLEDKTGQYRYVNREYEGYTANSFANEKNLPPDFIADLRRMETESPNHYQQYVMNSFEITESDDFVFTLPELLEAQRRDFATRTGYGMRLMGFDIARYGNDKCAAVGLVQVGALLWKMFHVEQWEHKDLDYTTGRILATSNQNHATDNIIDEDGLGAGPLDFITRGRQRQDFHGFRNKGIPYDENKDFANPRTKAAFKLKDMVSKGWIALPNQEVIEELLTLKYKYANDGRRILVSKEELRKEGIKSPNMADALLMAVSLIDRVRVQQQMQYPTNRIQTTSREENLFAIAGIR